MMIILRMFMKRAKSVCYPNCTIPLYEDVYSSTFHYNICLERNVQLNIRSCDLKTKSVVLRGQLTSVSDMQMKNRAQPIGTVTL